MAVTSRVLDTDGGLLLPEEPRYERDRSASPRPMKRDDGYRGGRDRSASPNGRMNSRYVQHHLLPKAF